MARADIMPFKSPLGNTFELRHYPVTASQTFQMGEPVALVDAGTLTEPPQDVDEFKLADIDTVGNVCGIAAWGPGAATSAADPNSRAAINPQTGVAYAVGGDIGIWPADQGTLFITDNFFAAAGGSAVVPAGTDRGEIYQITYATFGTPDGGWGIEQTAGVPGTDVVAVVHDVLNSRYEPIAYNDTTTGVYVVFEMKTK